MFLSSFIILWHNSPMRLKLHVQMQKQIDCDFSYCQVDKWKQANEKNYIKKSTFKDNYFFLPQEGMDFWRFDNMKANHADIMKLHSWGSTAQILELEHP